MYIVLNGVDGSGKDTQFQKLLTLYPEAIQIREPGGTPIAEVIRDILLSPTYTREDYLSLIYSLLSHSQTTDTCKSYLKSAYDEIKFHGLTARSEVFLYAASRAQTNQTLVIPSKKNQQLILGRRSIACSMSYQGFARQSPGIDMPFVWKTNAAALQHALPDLEIFLDLSPELAFERLRGRTEKQDRLDGESDQFHARTRDGYLAYYREFCPYPYVIISANGSVDDVFGQVLSIIENHKKEQATL